MLNNNSTKSPGFVYNTLNYRRQKLKSQISQGIEQMEADKAVGDDGIIDNMNEAMQDLNMGEKEYSESGTEENLTFSKTCIVSKEKSALIEKLSETMNLRCEIPKANKRDIREIFPFYFVDPDLVIP